jgi:hypothetical protein
VEQKQASKELAHKLHSERFKKTPEEREQLKLEKSKWKKLNPNKK